MGRDVGNTTKEEMKDAEKIDGLIADLESRGLGWAISHIGDFVEVRVMDIPRVLAKYRALVEMPLHIMLMIAMNNVDWEQYPKK